MKKTAILIVIFLFPYLNVCGKIHFNHVGKAKGLSQLSVMSICQDELGRMWFGTMEGLNCYDGEHIVSFKSSGQYPFLGNQVYNVVSDKQGSIVFTNDDAVHHYDIYTEQFTLLRNSRSKTLYSNDSRIWMANRDSLFVFNRANMDFDYVFHHSSISGINAICFDPEGRLWLGALNGLFCVNSIDDIHSPSHIIDGTIRDLYCDSHHNMWAVGYRSGMYKITDNNIVRYISGGENSLSSDDVRTVTEDDAGNIWIATFRGLNKLDQEGNFSYYRKDELPGSLKHSSVFSLYKDTQGSIWLGTYFSGAYHFDPRDNQVTYYVENANRDDCLSFFFVGRMAEDKRGDIWICTEGGGLNKLDRKTGKFTHYMANGKAGSIPDNNLLSIAYDESYDRLYVGGLYRGLFILDIESGKITRDVGIDQTGNSIMNMELHGDKLYLSSHTGCFVMDVGTKVLTRLFSGVHIHAFTVDSRNRLWLSLGNNTLCMMKLDVAEEPVYFYKKEDGRGLFMIPRIIEHKGVIYHGSFGFGLYKYDETAGEFEKCEAEGWNFDNYCYNIASSQQGDLVILQENGVVFFNPSQGTVRELNLVHHDINEGCGILICEDGEVFAGSANGMVSFKKDDLFSSTAPYSLYFSSLFINNQQIHSGEGGILDKALPFVDKIELRHNQNNILVDFTSNNYTDYLSNTKYEYKLVGLDKEWIASNESKVSYRNLRPGSYTLMVRDLKTTGEIGQSINLAIRVRSPWYASWIAYLCYFAVATGTIFFFIHNNRARLKLRYSLEMEKSEKEKNEEITRAKLHFFANISHEFRTPLTLIIGQIEMLFQNKNISPNLRNRLMKIYNNTFQLRELITELLSFSKINEKPVRLKVSRINMSVFVHTIYQKFREQASLKNIDYRFRSSADNIEGWFDPRQMTKVFQNLLSNAFKFTPDEGEITIEVGESEDNIIVSVTDTGEGIPAEAQSKIFEYFYQNDSSVSQIQGTGIGLTLAKSIVELHHGEIGVNSTPGFGSVFTVSLPKEYPFENDPHIATPADQPEEDEPVILAYPQPEEEKYIQPDIEEDPGKPSLLIVEDNEEMLQLLIELLSPLYRVSIALNGKEGFEKTLDERPDLILSDIAMPEMTGIEMCGKIKNHFDLCHIPVILLTAMASEGTNIQGLQCGADGYVEKPFSSRLLVGRIANTLRNREMLRRKYEQLSEDQTTGDKMQDIALTALDQKFLTRLNKLATDNISNPDFSVNTMAKEIGVSRSSLYNKLKALCNMTPNSYMLKIKLRRAAEMMKENPELQTTEIAYMLGFNSLRSFRYSFRAEYNLTPQDYRNQINN